MSSIGHLELAKLDMQKADLDAQTVLYSANIDLFDKDRKLRDSSTKAIDDLVQSYGQMFSNIINNMEKILSQTFPA